MPEGQSKWKQDFFDKAESIELKDPLAYTLGAVNEGDLLVFKYADAVKLAGHSCPAVSGAYKITAKALKFLYENDTPMRGDIKVIIKGKPTDLAYGPMSQVISLITGAAPVTGFRGIGGQFNRQNLLTFDEDNFEYNTFLFYRTDNGKGVKITYDTSVLPQDPKMGDLMQEVFSGSASKEVHEEFINLWQGKVKKILLDDDKYPGLFKVEKIL
ncbi:MAG: hypothetical protein HY279_01035 [Nitrospinae bacterium]|nr:hypothetical protein [Nitrospinota bacterium]